MLNYDNLSNIKGIDEHHVYFKDGKTLNTDNFTFVGCFETQEQLEDFDKKVKNIFYNEEIDEIKVFNLERDFALLSLNKERILDYFKKYDIPYDDYLNEEEFWASIHYSILELKSANKKLKDRSKEWLIRHNYKIY